MRSEKPRYNGHVHHAVPIGDDGVGVHGILGYRGKFYLGATIDALTKRPFLLPVYLLLQVVLFQRKAKFTTNTIY